MADEELGALVEQLQQARGDGAWQGHDEGQESPGSVRDAQEVDVVGELHGQDGVGEYWKEIDFCY